MFFEGSEKKFELSVNDGLPSLRSKGRSFWSACVEKSCAQILSVISSDSCDAYLLSESSLFVWDDRVTMITCGTTKLCDAALFLLNELQPVNVESFFYERKNEYYPRKQSSHFNDDVACLNKVFPGTAYRLGEANEHHLYLYHGDKLYEPPAQDRVIEILMYGLSGEAKDIFNCIDNCAKKIRNYMQLDKVFADFQFDDYAFQPIGYSCNAIRGSEYYTIHVSPQDEGAYVSFETNITAQSAQEITENVVNVFKPSCFDIIQFDSKKIVDISMENLVKKRGVRDTIGGYNVLYKTYYKPDIQYGKAEVIKIEDNKNE